MGGSEVKNKKTNKNLNWRTGGFWVIPWPAHHASVKKVMQKRNNDNTVTVGGQTA